MLVLAETFIALLLIYLFWYVQIFGNILLILYGASIASVICVGIHMISKREFFTQDFPSAIWMQLIMVIYLFMTSFLFASNKAAAISATLTYTAYCFVGFVIIYISVEKNSIDWLMNILMGITFLCCYWVTFKGIELPGYGMILGKHNNPNILGVMMLLGIFTIAYKARKNLNYLHVYLILSIWPIYIIVGCGSRKSLISAIAFIGLWIIPSLLYMLKTGETSAKIHIVLVIIIVCCIVLIYYFYVYPETNMAERMSHMNNEDSNSFRIFLYQEGFNLFKAHPFFGVGIDQFKHFESVGAYAHSTYAEMIADFGLVGSIIYCIPIIGVFIDTIIMLNMFEFEYTRILSFGIVCSELFLGVGQIFFFEPVHFVIWSIIYYLTFTDWNSGSLKNTELKYKGRYKYVKG